MKKIEKREAKKQDRGIVDFMMVTNHFFTGWVTGFLRWTTRGTRVTSPTARQI